MDHTYPCLGCGGSSRVLLDCGMCHYVEARVQRSDVIIVLWKHCWSGDSCGSHRLAFGFLTLFFFSLLTLSLSVRNSLPPLSLPDSLLFSLNLSLQFYFFSVSSL